MGNNYQENIKKLAIHFISLIKGEKMKMCQPLGFAFVTYSLLAALFSSLATASIHHGSVCNSLDQQNSKIVLKNSKGVQNIGNKAVKVICPLIADHLDATINPSDKSGGVLVDYRTSVPFSTSMSCTLYSYDYTGEFLGSASFTSGFNFYITLHGVPVGQWTNHSVVCTLQPLDRIIGIESSL